ncbi:aldo/keto reductase [Balneolaceae bacterium]|jgi:aryl-alcohol dehydrogenase-like predicted oxidoreductase|nr:aldo/keto reductase [Balneolaceae bacterium]
MKSIKNSKIALGTAQFGLDYGISNPDGKTSLEEVSKILDTAFNNGIRILDTAQVYGDSESVLGTYQANRFKIITKINLKNQENDTIESFVNKSLNNLQVENLYGLLFHDAKTAIQYPNMVREFRVLKDKGVIAKWGYSVYIPSELEQLIHKYEKPDIIQVPFSHLDQRFEMMAQNLHHHGVEIHTRSTFLQGLFFKPKEELADFFDPLIPYIRELKNTFLDEVHLAQALLNYCLTRDFIDYVVIGVNNVYQLQQNLDALSGSHADLPKPPDKVSENLILPYLWPK